MSTTIVVSKNGNVTTFASDNIQHGIFFRWPFIRVDKPDMVWSENEMSFHAWYRRAKRLLLPILYNWKQFKKAKQWMREDNFGGAYIRELVSPIYFSRRIISAEHHVKGSSTVRIEAWGEVAGDEMTPCNCCREHVKVTMASGLTKKFVSGNILSFVRNHVVEATLFPINKED